LSCLIFKNEVEENLDKTGVKMVDIEMATIHKGIENDIERISG
jgi:hypothetical protein